MNELLWLLMAAVHIAGIMIAFRLWGKNGLLIWIALATVIANIQVTKSIELFGLTATLGNIAYGTVFLATDIINELYGQKEARKAVGVGFFSLILFALAMNTALLFSPGIEDFAHPSLVAIFGFMPRLVTASLTAYVISQVNDIWLYGFWKKRLPGRRYIWVRNNISTMISQIFDTLIFVGIAFWGVFSLPVLMEIAVTTYIFKWLVAVIDTPVLYFVTGWKRPSESV